MISVKVCGINAPEAFDAAVTAGADYLGFVFFPPSPRAVTPSVAASLSGRLAGGPPRVGLFVDPTLAVIEDVLASVPLHALQVYGAADRLAAIKARFGLPIWRAVGVAAPADLPDDPGPADRLVIEAKPPPHASRPGGNATAFDWSLLHGWRPPVPWLLAGGLTVGNVGAAIRQTGAETVDVSSGVERAKGVKDASLIRGFIEAAKQDHA